MSKKDSSSRRIFYVYNKSIDSKDIFPCHEDSWRLLQALYFFNNENGFCNLFYEIEKRKNLSPLEGLEDHAKKEGRGRRPLVCVIGYCLERDGFHFILEEEVEGGVSKMMQRITTGYTKYFNNKYQREGHLFKGKFKSVEIKCTEELKYYLTYVNVIIPSRSLEAGFEGKVSDPRKALSLANDYFWSTHQVFINKRKPVLVEGDRIKEVFPSPKEYLSYVGSIIYEERKGFYIEPRLAGGR